jgi:membrane protein DedA with SNARE-associated domain
MVGLGASYGPIAGALLGAAGSLGALATGHQLGRAGTRFVDRVGTPAERARGHRMLRRWGPVAVIASRPVPVLAETVAVLTGAAGLPRHHVLLAGILGVTPMAAAYAMAGAWARGTGALGVVVLLGLIALAALTALALRRRATSDSTMEVSR